MRIFCRIHQLDATFEILIPDEWISYPVQIGGF